MITFVFHHNGRIVSFHFCDDVEDAKNRFQARYGYWPADPVRSYSTE